MPKKTERHATSSKKVGKAQAPLHRSSGRDYLAILFVAAGIFLFLCLFSYDPKDPSFNVATTRPHLSNLCGLIGSHVADALVQLVGISAIAVPLGFLICAVRLFTSCSGPMRWTDACSLLLVLSGVSALLERFWSGPVFSILLQHPGGALGAFVHGSFHKLLGSAGEILVSVTIIIVSLLHLSKVTMKEVSRCATVATAIIVRAVMSAAGRVGRWRRAREEYLESHYHRERTKIREPQPVHVETECNAEDEDEDEDEAPIIAERFVEDAPLRDDVEDAGAPCIADSFDIGSPDIHSWQRLSFLPEDQAEGLKEFEEHFEPIDDLPISLLGGAEDSEEPHCQCTGTNGSDEEPAASPATRVTHAELEEAIEEFFNEELSSGKAVPTPSPVSSEPVSDGASRPIRVTKRADEEISTVDPDLMDSRVSEDFHLPPLDLLDQPDTSNRYVDEQVLEQNARVLEQKLSDLKIKGEVVEIHPGPVITMYELILAPGIPLRKVLSTADDLAMALKCGSTRVVAPIPGKDTVGIEVPNANREIVYFREIIESKSFGTSTEPLKIALGKGIDGEPFASSLARMPHLLIAGATGTGKSVGLNCLICSWLMSCDPDDVKFLMVDPKKLELSYYQDIPHLLHPVVTDPEQVPKVLSWAIREMERRYDLLSEAGAKNIAGYNQKVTSGQLSGNGSGEEDATPPEKLPYLVIIVDELAELMMVAAKDIEISIARLAQMARAAGIHLILATQRPSVDVITGVIKANFPARISYQVSAKPDSRTILDTTGAENLLGMGDMLFLPPGTAKMRRLHGAFVSENEISNIVDFIKAQRSPVYLKEIAKHVSEDDSASVPAELIDDEKYDDAVQLVTRLGHASISLIQRHMRIGYNRAARIIEAMEAEGIIGPSDGTSRPREVLARSLESIPDSPF